MSIINLDKMLASYNGNLESVKYNGQLVNGNVVVLGSLVTGETELRTATAPTAVATEEVVLVSAPEVIYSEVGKSLKDFVIPANQPARAYHLFIGDIFTLTDDAIDGITVKDQFVIPQNGSVKLIASATGTGTRLCLKVLDKVTLGFDGASATVMQVVKN